LGIRRWHVERGAVKSEHIGWTFAFIVPGAVAANTNIALPDYAKPAKSIKQAIHLARAGVVHSACAATGAVHPSDTTLAPVVFTFKILAIVTTTLESGQIQLYDENNVRLGDATVDGDLLILVVEKKP